MTSVPPNSRRPTYPVLLHRAIEATWLAALAIVPLAVIPESQGMDTVDVPKAFLLRTAALLLLVLWAFERALTSPSRPPERSIVGSSRFRSATQRAKQHPIAVSVVTILVVTSLSTLFSPIPAVSLWGVDVGQGSHSLLSAISMGVIFAVVATHLRTLAQLRRLLWAVVGSSMLAGLYGVAQHYGVDPFRVDAFPISRAPLSFGNPIFAASYLLMTIPLALALWQGWRDRMSAVNHVWIGGGLIALQVTGIAFTLSRGPLIGLAIAIAVFLGSLAWLYQPRIAVRPAASLALAIAFAAIMSALPVANATDVTLASRFADIGSPLSVTDGALSGRVTIWGTAIEAFTTVPWVDTSEFPEIPGLAATSLRPVLGYGPAMFGYAYVQVGDPTTTSVAEDGHNLIVHTAVELGLLGVLAYIALAVAVVVSVGRALAIARRDNPSPEFGFILAGLIGALAGRAVEQMSGVPQTSDILLFWMLVGAVQALPAVQASVQTPSVTAPSPSRRSGATARVRPAYSPAWISGASIVALAALLFWLQMVLAPANANAIAGRGLQASQTDRPFEAGELMNRAVDLAPTSFLPAALLANAWTQNAKASEDPDVRGQSFANAYEVITRVFDRDPFNLRARMIAGEISRAQAVDSPAFADQAIHDYELVIALLPGLWEQREQLAWTLTSVGEHERALDVVAEAKQLGGADNPDAYFLYYVEGKALQGLGRDSEVTDVIATLNAIDSRFIEPLVADLTTP